MMKINVQLQRNESAAVTLYRETFGHGPAIEAYKFLSQQEVDKIAEEAVSTGKPCAQWRDRRKTETVTHLDGLYGNFSARMQD